MKIAIFTDRYPPAEGGVERYVQCIATELSKSHSVIVFAAIPCDVDYLQYYRMHPAHARNMQLIDDAGFTIVWVAPYFQRMLQLLLAVGHWCIRQSPKMFYNSIIAILRIATGYCLSRSVNKSIIDFDVIHSVATWEMSVAASICAKRVPHIITGFLHQGRWGDDVLSKRLFKKCSRIVALCETECLGYREIGVSSRKLHIVPVPICISKPYLETSVSEVLPLNQTIIFIGVKREYKGIGLLTEVAREFARDFPGVNFCFVGPRTPYSIDHFSKLGNCGNIQEYGAVSELQKIKLLRSSVILCLPSETEIMPTVILEAWREGIPVAVSSIPTLAEFVESAGYIFERNAESIYNGLSKLITDTNLRRTFVERGTERLLKFHSAEAVAGLLEGLYSNTISERRMCSGRKASSKDTQP